MLAARDHPRAARRLVVEFVIRSVLRIRQAHMVTPLCMYAMFRLALVCVGMLEVCRIPSGRAGFRQGEYGSGFAFRLQGTQGVTSICLVAEAIAIAGSCLPVHPAKIVEGQETACVDRNPHVLSVDFRRKLGQSTCANRVIPSGCTNSVAGPG